MQASNYSAWCSYDDLRIYNTALSAAQVQSIYAAQGMPSRGVQLNVNSVPYGAGGTVTTVGGNRIHTFTTVGSSTFTCYQSGYVQLLVVAGGGGGGANGGNSAGGGGGAGEYYYSASYLITPGVYTVTVGAGGAGGVVVTSDGGDGSVSVFGSISANGGGGGSSGFVSGVWVVNPGRPGGSGGGAGRGATLSGGASVTTAGGLGNKGGDNTNGANFSAGGGGGSGSAGTNASASGSSSIPGGSGTASSISGASVTYASGGSGGARSGTYTPSAATANQGNGGDGAPGGGTAGSNARNGGAGGSGIVIVAYPNTTSVTSLPSVSGTPLFSQLSSSAVASSVGAFSLRAVNGRSAKAVQVKRSSDNATQDFYADRLGNLLTAPVTGTTLENWLGGATGYVTTWYDQSGKGNHATQATAANQPSITLDANNRYQIDFSASTAFLNIPSGTVPMQTAYTVTTHHNAINNTAGGICGAGNNVNNQANNFRRGTASYYNYWWNNDVFIGTYAVGNIMTWKFTAEVSSTAGTTYVYQNNTLVSSASRTGWAGVNTTGFIGKTTNNEYLQGQLYSLFLFSSALSDVDRLLTENVS